MGEEQGFEMTNEDNSSTSEGGSNKNTNKAKSCKGCLYYSSQLKTKHRNPLCVGFSRALQQAYANKKDTPADQHGQAELPYCVGIELLVDRRASAGTPVREHEHAHRKEETPVLPRPPSTHRPPHTIGDEFIGRFYRNAGLVAGGVARNLYRVGNYVKANLDDILYPYRRRPK